MKANYFDQELPDSDDMQLWMPWAEKQMWWKTIRRKEGERMSIKYLMLFEDNSLWLQTEISDMDKLAAEDGYMDIIRIDTEDGSIQQSVTDGWIDVKEQQ